MASVNKVIIVGNLGRDPEIRYMPSGDAIANIAVATSYKSKDRNTGEQKELTEWHRISFFGRLAEIVGQYLKKGSSVYVEGRLQTRKYTDKDGVEKYATDIIAEQMQMLGGRHGAVFQVDVRRFQRRGGGLDVCLGLLEGGDGIIVLLTADAFDGYQFLVARCFRTGRQQIGLGFRQRGLGRVVGGLVGGRVDLIQGRARFHIATLDEQAFLDQTAHLRAHIGHLVGIRTAGQFGAHRQRGRINSKHDHLRRLLRVRCFLFFTAAGHDYSGAQNGNSAARTRRRQGKGWLHLGLSEKEAG